MGDDEMYDRAQQHLEGFYVEVFLELANYGEIEDLVVVDNLCDHMIGNVYVKYYHEEDAERALMKLTGRFYSGKLIQAEYTTVYDFREARCRAFHETRCNRGGGRQTSEERRAMIGQWNKDAEGGGGGGVVA